MSSCLGEDTDPAVGKGIAPRLDQLGSQSLQGPCQSPSVAAVPRQMLLRTHVFQKREMQFPYEE